MAVAIPRMPAPISSSGSPSMASWYSQRRSASSSYLPHPAWPQQATAATTTWSSTAPVQYGGSEFLVEANDYANDYASSSDDFLEQFVESPKSVGEVRAPSPQVLYSLPDTFDPRGSQAQESAVKAEPSATDAFVFDNSNVARGPALTQFGSCSQVPLRATQASKEMRALMGVFRINPFAFHGGPPPPNVAGPLATPGKHFEWQLPTEVSEERALQDAYDATHEIQSARYDVGSEAQDPSYGYPPSTLASRRSATQLSGYSSPSYIGSSSGSYPHSRTYPSPSAKVEYGYPLPELAREAQASWTTYPTRASVASSAGGSRPGTSGTGYSGETYQGVHDTHTVDVSSGRYVPAHRQSYDEPQSYYHAGHGSGSIY
ncbi:unnamed protein product [Peniophora sp. CBMAI 1063]|nr:unnamed protein product [Peniophora sp. CBMAI 1063]